MRKKHFTRDVVFQEFIPYYENNLKLQRLSRSCPDGERSSECDMEQESEPQTVAVKLSAIAAKAAQKIKPRNIQRNHGPAWKPPEDCRRRRERTS